MATKIPRPPAASTAEAASKILEPKSKIEKKKRPALADITNLQNGPQDGSRVTGSLPKSMVLCSTTNAQKKGLPANTSPASAAIRTGVFVPYEDGTCSRVELPLVKSYIFNSQGCVGTPVSSLRDSTMPKPEFVDTSPMAIGSLCADETISTCDSLTSQESECADNEKSSGLPVPEGKTSTADNEDTDSQPYTISAFEIYKNLQDSEDRKRPSFVYMESVQRDVNSSMRAILIDWLVEVAEEFRLGLETLHLAVNYIDRYLSENSINRKQLQLLGVACMMIAAKYEEILVPTMGELCSVTAHTYSKEEVLQMEKSVLNHLKFDMAVPTAHCFLRLIIPAAQETTKISSVKFECLAYYITELSLEEYRLLRYAPSMIAASATFLARFMLCPSEKPWNSTLTHYTMYQPSELCDCVKALHRLCLNSCSYLPGVREKYSRHKYKFVAKKYCPITIPPNYFEDCMIKAPVPSQSVYGNTLQVAREISIG